ncbi:MAG: hypothetical protein LJE75_13565 [Gammaproteobacteria bacterium]|nr:hypothetical protein [Gammaproteobacteria bacterium]
MAESSAKLFAPVQGAGAGKALPLIRPGDLLNRVKSNEPLLLLNVRTPAILRGLREHRVSNAGLRLSRR